MNLYIDMIFAVNMSMNAIIFALVAKVSKRKVRLPRILLGAGLSAALYCILLVFLRSWFNPVTAVAMLIAGLFVTFGAVELRNGLKGVKPFALLVLYAHGIAFFIGGMALALFHYLNTDVIFGVMRHFPMGLLFWSVLGSYAALQLGHLYLQKLRMSKQLICELSITHGAQSISVNALVDTGNSLRDPHNHWPVIIIEESTLTQLVSTGQLLSDMPEQVRMIPYKTIGNQGSLVGFVPDKLQVTVDNQAPATLSQVIVGLCSFTLSKTGEYQALIGPSCLAN